MLLWDKKRTADELAEMEKMRASTLYQNIYPIIKDMRRVNLDRVVIERDKIEFFGMNPSTMLRSFCFSQHGLRMLKPRRLWALTQVLAEDMAELNDRRHFRLQIHRVELPNGAHGNRYIYCARSDYKTEMMTAGLMQPAFTV